jgi:hypothetical protein
VNVKIQEGEIVLMSIKYQDTGQNRALVPIVCRDKGQNNTILSMELKEKTSCLRECDKINDEHSTFNCNGDIFISGNNYR